MNTWQIINLVLTIIVSLLVAYQVLYVIIGLFWKKKFKDTNVESSYGVLIAGRNEEKVIGQLIDSIKKQNYNQDIIVVEMIKPQKLHGKWVRWCLSVKTKKKLVRDMHLIFS